MPKYIIPIADIESQREFNALDSFTQGYITAVFWTSEAPGVTTEEWQATEEHDEGSVPGDVGFSDLAPETLRRMTRDCARFQEMAERTLSRAYDESSYTEHQAGIDFWLTRNHHGSGFDDCEISDTSKEELTEIAHCFTEVDVYLGDDGKVYT